MRFIHPKGIVVQLWRMLVSFAMIVDGVIGFVSLGTVSSGLSLKAARQHAISMVKRQ